MADTEPNRTLAVILTGLAVGGWWWQHEKDADVCPKLAFDFPSPDAPDDESLPPAEKVRPFGPPDAIKIISL
jgi:hypothetical protein